MLIRRGYPEAAANAIISVAALRDRAPDKHAEHAFQRVAHFRMIGGCRGQRAAVAPNKVGPVLFLDLCQSAELIEQGARTSNALTQLATALMSRVGP